MRQIAIGHIQHLSNDNILAPDFLFFYMFGKNQWLFYKANFLLLIAFLFPFSNIKLPLLQTDAI